MADDKVGKIPMVHILKTSLGAVLSGVVVGVTLLAVTSLVAAQGQPSVAQQSVVESSFNTGLTNFVIALTSLVTAIGIIWVNVIVAKAKARIAETSEVVIKRADEIGETTKSTLHQVNGAATELRAVIVALRQENTMLRQSSSDNKEIAAVLAATHAAESPRQVRASDSSPVLPSNLPKDLQHAATPILKAIEENTGAIKNNTAKTDATVTEMKKDAQE